jgi:hypothetical protein
VEKHQWSCGGGMPPIIETHQKIVNIVGNCQNYRWGGGGVKDLKCSHPENFFVFLKSTANGPQKNMGPTDIHSSNTTSILFTRVNIMTVRLH